MIDLTVDIHGNIYDGEKVLRQRSDGRGYLCITYNGVTHKAHKVVCTVAHGRKPSKHHLPMHRNNIKTDNRPCNLSWGTRSDNVRHAHESGDMKRNNKKMVRCFIQVSNCITLQRFFDSVNQAAKEYGVSPGTIASAASGKSKTASGLFWEYV